MEPLHTLLNERKTFLASLMSCDSHVMYTSVVGVVFFLGGGIVLI